MKCAVRDAFSFYLFLKIGKNMKFITQNAWNTEGDHFLSNSSSMTNHSVSPFGPEKKPSRDNHSTTFIFFMIVLFWNYLCFIFLFRTFPFRKLGNIMATGNTGVSVRFTITTTNRFVNLGANTIWIGGFFDTITWRQRLFTTSSRQNDRYTEGGKKSDYFFHDFYFILRNDVKNKLPSQLS